jgi:hypothetical protein
MEKKNVRDLGALEGILFEDETVTYTTAPADYDWFGTHTIEECAGTTINVFQHQGRSENGKTIRKVSGPANRVEAQRGRYSSGNHMAVDETEWKKLVDYKLVTPHLHPTEQK